MLKSAIILLAAFKSCESGFFEQVKAPDLRSERPSWSFPSGEDNTQIKREAKSLLLDQITDESQTSQRRILTGVFLPGLGVYRDVEVETFDKPIPTRRPRKTKSQIDQGLFSSNSIDDLNAPLITTSTEMQAQALKSEESYFPTNTIKPSRITVSQDKPPAGLRRDDDKCEYIQMKGGTLGEECMKGGMSCERQCKFDVSDDECVQVEETVCEDVAKNQCQTVMEKTCSTVQESLFSFIEFKI